MSTCLRTAFVALFALAGQVTAQDPPPPRPIIVEGDKGAELDAYLTACARFGFSGSVYVSQRGKTVLQKSYGIADPRTSRPCTPDTLFDIASTSKPITAVAIMKLESEGKLSRKDSIADYLPGVPKQHRKITIDHLLTHTSGFPRNGPSGSGADLEAAVATYLSGEVTAKPGKRHEYWNGGYALLAGIVQKVSGQAYEDYVRDHVFAPAQLIETDFIETARVTKGRIARSHRERNPLATDYIKGWGYRGMGGVLTSASDLGHWTEALMQSDVILAKKARKAMLKVEKDHYARGWYSLKTKQGRLCVQHGGDALGFHTYLRYFPEDELVTTVLCNVDDMHWQVAWGIEALWFGHEPQVPHPPTPAALNTTEVARWIGSWKSKDGAQVRVIANGAQFEVIGSGPDLQAALGAAGTIKVAHDPTLQSLAVKIMSQLVSGSSTALEGAIHERLRGSIARTAPKGAAAKQAEFGKVGQVEFLFLHGESADVSRAFFRLHYESGPKFAWLYFEGGRASGWAFAEPTQLEWLKICPLDAHESMTYRFGQADDELRFKLDGKKLSVRGKGVKLDLVSAEDSK